jgi:prophage antirepressor-like protein
MDYKSNDSIKTPAECKLYNSIPDTTNILSTLVDSITNDILFQKHVNVLHISENPIDQKKAQMIKSTINNIRVFNTKVTPLFLAKDIGILLGISHIKYLIRKFEDEEKVIGFITTTNNKSKKVVFLTRHGIYRCFYASRSPLAKLFRKFIGNLLDHMITHETELLRKISAVFKVENPELIEQGVIDLKSKLVEYETKYIDEQKRAQILEEQYGDEQKKRQELETENTEIDIINSYNMMHIEQLRQDGVNYITRIKNMQHTVIPDDDSSIDLLEIKLLKEKYMKPVYIYILHPDYFKKLLLNKQKDLLKKQQYIKASTQTLKDFERSITTAVEGLSKTGSGIKDSMTTDVVVDLINDLPVYKRNFDHVFSDTLDQTKPGINIQKDEILHFLINYSRNIEKKPKMIHVDTQWVASKKHFSKTLDSLSENCTIVTFDKITLYKTSIEEISEIIREEFVSL